MFVHCKDCVYWLATGLPFKTGRCRRHAPSPLMTAEAEEPDVDLELAVVWPLTVREDGCGDGEKRGNDR